MPWRADASYRGPSLIRNTTPVGPYSSPMPRDLWRPEKERERARERERERQSLLLASRLTSFAGVSQHGAGAVSRAPSLRACVCVFACVCMCVRERERARERKSVEPDSQVSPNTERGLCPHVQPRARESESESESERESERARARERARE